MIYIVEFIQGKKTVFHNMITVFVPVSSHRQFSRIGQLRELSSDFLKDYLIMLSSNRGV